MVKSYGGSWVVGGIKDFSVSPRPPWDQLGFKTYRDLVSVEPGGVGARA